MSDNKTGWFDEPAAAAADETLYVDVDGYEGPLDLLLDLARRQKVDLAAISVLALAEQRAVYWSRSRNRIWRKGEESGHVQTMQGIYLDCDADAVIYMVEQQGGIACHTGRESCFYSKLVDGQWQTVDPVLKDPTTLYSGKRGAEEWRMNTQEQRDE